MNYKLRKRLSVISLSTVYNLCTSLFSAIISLLVIRLCSQALWGSMVEVLLWTGISAHILYWGNKDFLLRKFSLEPMKLHHHWQKNMHTRIWMALIAIIIPFFLPINTTLKCILPIFLAARFVYQSYDVVILFKKKFITSIIIELMAFAMIITFIWFSHVNVSLNRLVGIFALAELTKALAMFLIFRKELPLSSLRFNKEYFISALPFFMLGFTGLFQSKVDLMCVTFFLPRPQIAQYQVYISFLLLVQASSSFILAPFAKNIYRLKRDSITKISLRLFALGIITSAIALPLIDYLIKTFYHFSLPRMALLSGGLFVIPVFYYSPIIYYMLKLNSQRKVLLINVAGIFVAFLLNVILIPLSSNGISGATDAIAITQWVLLVICILTGRMRSGKPNYSEEGSLKGGLIA